MQRQYAVRRQCRAEELARDDGPFKPRCQWLRADGVWRRSGVLSINSKIPLGSGLIKIGRQTERSVWILVTQQQDA
jgi:hypothetical protein